MRAHAALFQPSISLGAWLFGLGSLSLVWSACQAQAPVQTITETHAQSNTQTTRSTTQTTTSAPSTNPIPAAPAPAIPAGTQGLKGRNVVAMTCEPAKLCPLLKWSNASKYCTALEAAPGPGWRLPTRDEAQAFHGISTPAMANAYHWTTTTFERDAQQYWIINPEQPQVATTYRGEQKAFFVRCVRDLK